LENVARTPRFASIETLHVTRLPAHGTPQPTKRQPLRATARRETLLPLPKRAEQVRVQESPVGVLRTRPPPLTLTERR
jgi:hypothetical protein